MNAVFGQRNADGVPDSIGQERADANRALDPRVLAFTGFGDTEMNRIIPILALLTQPRDEQPIGVDHYFGVARFHRKNEGVIIEVPRDTSELERAFDHA